LRYYYVDVREATRLSPDRHALASKATVTLRDIAARLNVSTASVSRALAGQVGVGARRAARIQHVAAEMGYRPRPLRRKRTKAIAVLVGTDQPGQPDEDFSQRLVILASRAVTDLGLHVHIEFVPRHDKDRVPAVLTENRVDGALLGGHPSAGLLRFVEDNDMPAVVMGGSCEWVSRPCVNPDPTAAVREVMDRLLSLGHRRIGIAISHRKYPVTQHLYRACREALQQRGVGLPERDVIEGLTPDMLGGRLAVERFLDAGGEMPTAILFTNDWMALGGILSLTARGCRIGQDVSVIGQDNLPWCNQTEPALSSIDHHEAEMVRAAVHDLSRQMEGGSREPRSIEIPSQPVWRSSCGPVAGRRRGPVASVIQDEP